MAIDTPRGYSFPCYSDSADFPTRIQDLAEDIDEDVQTLVDDMDQGRNLPPSLRITSTTSTALTAGTAINISFSTEAYDNSGMFAPTSTDMTVTVEGMYMVSASVLFSSSTGLKTCGITLNNFLRAVNTRRSFTGDPLTVNVHGLAYGSVGSTFRVIVESSTACNAITRNFTATRLSGLNPL